MSKNRLIALNPPSGAVFNKILILTLIVILAASCTGPVAQPAQVVELTPTPVTETTSRGADGVLRMFSPDAPTLLNPHLSSSGQNLLPSRMTYEPLASFDKDGQLIPFLADRIPSLENGGVAADGKSVTWELKRDVQWSDGILFSADDVLFTYEFITNPDVKAVTTGTYSAVASVEVLNSYTVKINFKDVTPAWYLPFVGWPGVILPRHIFGEYNGANARDAHANIEPVGTGPYMVLPPGIKPQEVWFLGTQLIETNKIIYEPNPYFRDENKPYFSRIELLGGGRTDEAAQLVMDEGTVDFAFILGEADPETIARVEQSDQAMLVTNFGAVVERILINQTDPNKEVDGERSSIKAPHPFFSDKKVRQALAYAIDREAIGKLYGVLGKTTANVLVSPPQYNSPQTFYTFDLKKAAQLLDEAGWVDSNKDGVREKDGVKLKIVFQTYISPTAQQYQQIIKEALKSIGVEVELKITDSSIMFGSPLDNPDHFRRFNSDIESFSSGSSSPDPGPLMRRWTCGQEPQKANNWVGGNAERWCNPSYDALYQQAITELDPEKRQKIFIQMNDMLIEEVVMIPLVIISYNSGLTKTDISGVDLTPWDMITWNIMDWRRTSP